MAKAANKEPSKQVLPARNLSLKEYVSPLYWAIIPAGHTRELLESPNYWCHIASKLKRNTEIVCVAEDYSFYGRGLVTDATTATARVWFTTWVERADADTEAPDLSDDYKIDQNAAGFRIIHKETRKVVKENMATKKEALMALADLSTK